MGGADRAIRRHTARSRGGGQCDGRRKCAVFNAEDLHRQAKRGEAAVDRVRSAIRRLEAKSLGEWPESPALLFQESAALDRLLRHARIGAGRCRNLLEALVFCRDEYCCRYCGREAFAFYESTGRTRTLILVVDHLRRCWEELKAVRAGELRYRMLELQHHEGRVPRERVSRGIGLHHRGTSAAQISCTGRLTRRCC